MAVVRHVAQGRDRAHVVVPALDPPRRNGAVVHGSAQGEVELDVPFEIVEHVTLALDLLDSFGLVRDVVGDHEPVARGRFRVGTIGPELGQHPGVVAPRNHLRGVGEARAGVDGMSRPPVAAVLEIVERLEVIDGRERGVPDGAGRDIDGHSVGGVQVTRPGGNQLEAPFVVGIPRAAQ